MKKIVKIAVVVSLAALLVSACGSSGGKGGSTNSSDDAFFSDDDTVSSAPATIDDTITDLPPAFTDEPAPTGETDAGLQIAMDALGITGDEKFNLISPSSELETYLISEKAKSDKDPSSKAAFIDDYLAKSDISEISHDKIASFGAKVCSRMDSGTYKHLLALLVVDDNTDISEDMGTLGRLATLGVGTECPTNYDEYLTFWSTVTGVPIT